MRRERRRRPRATQRAHPRARRARAASARAGARDRRTPTASSRERTATTRPTSRCARPPPRRTCPNASFAGQQETLPQRPRRRRRRSTPCARLLREPLHRPRAISYRARHGLRPHAGRPLGRRAEDGALRPRERGRHLHARHRDRASATSCSSRRASGLGESVVQGARRARRVLRPQADARSEGFRPLVWKKLGDEGGAARLRRRRASPGAQRAGAAGRARARSRSRDDDVLELARWAVRIEEHYSKLRGEPTPMDIEWAKDGVSGELFIVQARPETVHSRRGAPTLRLYELDGHARAARRPASRSAMRSRRARRASSAIRSRSASSQPGEILVTEMTDPDWEPIMKKAAGDRDRARRAHLPRGHRRARARHPGRRRRRATRRRRSPTAAWSPSRAREGDVGRRVRRARSRSRSQEIDASTLARPRTQDHAQRRQPRAGLQARAAAERRRRPRAHGVHLRELGRRAPARADALRDAARPRRSARSTALTRGYDDKTAYFVDRLAQGIATIAAAFYPRPVILRFSDFKTNEYAKLVGGASFEPTEENPMLGLARREPLLPPGLQGRLPARVSRPCERVREEMGLDEPEGDDPVLPHAGGGRARARDDARGRARARRERARGLRDGRDPVEHPPRRASSRRCSTASRSARTTSPSSRSASTATRRPSRRSSTSATRR